MSKRKKDNIDYSDIPATDENFWTNAEIIMPKKKQSLTIRLDYEVVEWFRSGGPGYQTQINAVLKSFMQQAKSSGKDINTIKPTRD